MFIELGISDRLTAPAQTLGQPQPDLPVASGNRDHLLIIRYGPSQSRSQPRDQRTPRLGLDPAAL